MQQNKKRNLVRCCCMIITLVILFMNFNREVINAHDGAGWDGGLYLKVTRTAYYLKERSLNQYHIQRVLVPLIVNRALWITNSAKTLPDIIFAYRVFNLSCILLAIFFFFKISKHLSLSIKSELIGFCCLFWTFPVLKLSSYYPLLTDIAAFTLGVIFVYYYLRNSLVGMFSVIFLGCFVYPTFSLLLPLVFFKKENIQIEKAKLNLQRFILPIAFASIIILLFIYNKNRLFSTISDTAPVNEWLFPVSIVVGMMYMYYISNLLPTLKQQFLFFKFINLKRLFLCVALYAVIFFVRTSLSSRFTGFTLPDFLMNISKQSITNPGIFILAHTVYFGLFYILIGLFSSQIKTVVLSHGNGMLYVVMAIGILSVGNESRQLLNFYPLIAVVCIMALQSFGKVLHNIATGFFLVCSLAISSFWEKLSFPGELEPDFLVYPGQKYFRYQGPWMSNSTYYLYLALFIAVIAVFFILHKANKLFVQPVIAR